jgi:hypothetical protein
MYGDKGNWSEDEAVLYVGIAGSSALLSPRFARKGGLTTHGLQRFIPRCLKISHDTDIFYICKDCISGACIYL